MKTTLITSILVLGLAGAGLAAKPGKKDKGKGDRQAQKAAVEALKPYDKNSNKEIDGDELAAVQKAFTEAPSGALAALDKNKDGKLEASEVKLRGRGAIGGLVKELDKDGNRKLEGPELDALKKKFEAEPKGSLAELDKNSDGKLEDGEIKALTDRLDKRAAAAGEKSGKKTKKKPAAAPEASTPAKPDAPKPETKGEEVKKPEASKS